VIQVVPGITKEASPERRRRADGGLAVDSPAVWALRTDGRGTGGVERSSGGYWLQRPSTSLRGDPCSVASV